MIQTIERTYEVSEKSWVQRIYETVSIPLLFVTGIFFPSSINGNLSKAYELGIYVPLLILVSGLLIFQKTYNKINLITSFVMIFSLLLFTLTGSMIFHEVSMGIFPAYLILALVQLLNIHSFEYSQKLLSVTLIIVSVIQIFFGINIVLINEDVRGFLIDNYSAGYDSLVPTMIGDLKPVTTFGSHSIAGFYFFILFFLNFMTFKVTKKSIFFVTSVLLLLLLVFIRSNTAYLYTAVSFVYMLVGLSRKPLHLVLFLLMICISVALIYVQYKELIDVLLEYDVQTVTGHSGSGLAGRYTSGNYLSVTIDFIKEHPFTPIGLSYSDTLFFTDSGIIVYFLRGSVFLIWSIYFGFFHFLKRNLKGSELELYALFLIYLVFEVGYPNLINSRSLGCIPFIVIYLNYLHDYQTNNEG
jgi:hypothetical protein